jgi:hypothetical protein
MAQTLEELQAVLAERIQGLDEERKANTLQQAKAREEMLREAEIERKQRLEEYERKVEALEAKKKAETEAKEAKCRKENEKRLLSEQKQNALDETLRLQREKLEWLEKAISDAEFIEEQHRKALENAKLLPPMADPITKVSAEYPQTGADGGASTPGTDGSTPETPLMSSHLRAILRQFNKA